MKTLLFAGLVAVNLMLWAPNALANINCGIKPLPPIGCAYDSGRCVCDSNGNCHWVFDC